jgi:hypothetical protein
MAAGYSGTPLGKKLGVKDGQRTWRYGMPESVAAEIAAEGWRPLELKTLKHGLEMVHLFCTRREDLSKQLDRVRGLMEPTAMIWVSWPKKAAKMETDVNEDVVRAEAFPRGLVDVKVCAVDAVWSGLKLVIRRSER